MKLNSLHRVILCSLFAVTTVYAAGDKPVMFEDIDTNADGCISSKEAAVREDLVKNFDSIDKDKNGALCLDDFLQQFDNGVLLDLRKEFGFGRRALL